MDKDRILEHLSPQDVYGAALKKNSKGFVMLCPFHQDTAPSFQVYEDNKSFRCFGCGSAGSAYDFIMKRDGLDFLGALKHLAEKAGVAFSEANHPSERLFELNNVAQRIYTDNLLTGNPKALKYLTEERCLNMEMIERFRLGSANGVSVIPVLKSQGFTDEEIVTAGLVYRKDGDIRDLFRGRIIFPIIKSGKVLGFGGRIFGATEGPKYINSPATPVFQKKRVLYGLDSGSIQAKGYALLVEGYLDVITCHQHGFRNAASPLGTALSEEHALLMRKHTETVVPLFDGDRAGKIAAERTVKLLFDQKMKGSVVTLPEEEDPDSFMRKGGSLDELIGTSEPFGCFLAKRFPATRKIVFSSLMLRSSIETAEFISYMGTGEEAKAYMELNARTMIESLLEKAPIISRQRDVEVRKYKDYLALLSEKRFVLWRKIGGDHKRQAEEMVSQFQALRKNRTIGGDKKL
ncbi:MAG: DNA primase [Nitrospiraceae bacterium]|nr:DNA primase [Nitrospiraceae bacterium]